MAAASNVARKSFGGILRAARWRKVLRRRQIYSPGLCGIRRAASVVKPRLFDVFSGTKSEKIFFKAVSTDSSVWWKMRALR
jgi:hypothetical protein